MATFEASTPQPKYAGVQHLLDTMMPDSYYVTQKALLGDFYDYELTAAGWPTDGERQLDLTLSGIVRERQEPRSSNAHSVHNLRHYLFNGGTMQLDRSLDFRHVLWKPLWVEVVDDWDRCTLCSRNKSIDDKHLRSRGHRMRVQMWNDAKEQHLAATTVRIPPPPMQSAISTSTAASTPVANGVAEPDIWEFGIGDYVGYSLSAQYFSCQPKPRRQPLRRIPPPTPEAPPVATPGFS
jgi:hypothetical protein